MVLKLGVLKLSRENGRRKTERKGGNPRLVHRNVSVYAYGW